MRGQSRTRPHLPVPWRAPRPAALASAALALVMLLGAAGALWPRGALAHFAGNAASASNTYVDPKLRFRLRLPDGWRADSHPGMQWMARATTVALYDRQTADAQIELSVQQGAEAARAFAARGTPNAKVGAYAAFAADLAGDAEQGRGTCLVRAFLAASDYVVAQWCAPDAATHQQQFEGIIATYTPAGEGAFAASPYDLFAPLTMNAYGTRAQDRSPLDSRPAQCAELVTQADRTPPDLTNWGRVLASPLDRRWHPYPTPAVSVCSNFYYVNGRAVSYPRYTFQCTELANRFLREQFGHGALNGNAETYYDYYDGAGVRHPGTARIYPDAEFSDDAAQGTSAFKAVPGDLLVFQDVNDGAQWTSGLRPGSPGHVAVITGTDAGHIYMMQQNFSDALAYMAMPMTTVADGWHITDTSGVKGRIVRGWIHFAQNGGSAGASSSTAADTRQVYTVGGDGELYAYRWQDGGSWGPALNPRTSISVSTPTFARMAGTPSSNGYEIGGAARQSVFLVGDDGRLYEFWWRRLDGWHRDDISAATRGTLPDGVRLVGSPGALTYTAPGERGPRHMVFAVGSDGHLYVYSWALEAGWSGPADVSGAGIALAGSPGAIAWSEAGAQHLAAYATSRDGRLYEFRGGADGASWAAAELTALTSTGLPSGITFGGTPGAYAFALPGETAQHLAAYATGSDGHLYQFSWAPGSGGGAWTALDVSQTAAGGASGASGASGVRLVNTPSARYFVQGGAGVHDVFVMGADGHLYEYYFVNGGWRGLDVSAQVKGAPNGGLAGSPSASAYFLAADKADAAPHRSVYAVTTDGRLVEFAYQRGNATWSLADLGKPQGTSLAGNSPDGNAFAR